MARTFRRASWALCLLVASGAAAQAPDDPEKVRAERELQQVLQEIAGLQDEIRQSRTEQHKEQEQLRRLDLAVQEVNLEYRALEQEKQAHEAELRELEVQREAYLASLDERTAQLAEQVRSAYRNGGQSRTRLVLNQDDPTRIGRMLAYYDYVNRAQVEKIAGLRDAIARLESMQISIDSEIARIAELQEEQQAILEELEAQRIERAALLGQIAGRIDNSESQLVELQRNRQDLEDLLERLADALSDIPEDLDSHAGVAALKGLLPMPLQGPVRHAYGQDRGTGLNWLGWLIGAEPGTEVQAVAYGRVAFADWLRGYGLLLIIDHGEGFMTLYGQNESLLRDTGEWVNAGDAVSIVGANPGGNQGAYFEIRRDGKALDPAAWLAR